MTESIEYLIVNPREAPGLEEFCGMKYFGETPQQSTVSFLEYVPTGYCDRTGRELYIGFTYHREQL